MTEPDASLDDLAWQWMCDNAPFCHNGHRFLHGAAGDMPLLVCPECSYTEAVDLDWLDQQRNRAFEHAQRCLS